MTLTKILSVKVPLNLYRQMPGAHNGRSRFIIAALEDKLNRRDEEWQPTTAHGRKLKAILEKGAAERGAPMEAAGIARELAERRGRNH